MRVIDKLICRVTVGLFLVGIFFRGAGALMGGRAESKEYERSAVGQSWGPVQVDEEGFLIGGKKGVWINGDGIHFGDRENGGFQPETIEGEEIRESGVLTGITCVDVDVDWGDVWVRTGENFSVVLSWNVFGYAMDYRVENGVLKVESEETKDYFRDNFEFTSRVVITIPAETEIQKLEISTDFGDISVDAEELTAWEAVFDTNLGDVSSFGLTARTLEAESSLGDITIHFPEQNGVGYHLSSSLGKIKVNELSFQGECETLLTDAEQTYFIEAQTDLGDVTLMF